MRSPTCRPASVRAAGVSGRTSVTTTALPSAAGSISTPSEPVGTASGAAGGPEPHVRGVELAAQEVHHLLEVLAGRGAEGQRPVATRAAPPSRRRGTPGRRSRGPAPATPRRTPAPGAASAVHLVAGPRTPPGRRPCLPGRCSPPCPCRRGRGRACRPWRRRRCVGSLPPVVRRFSSLPSQRTL